MQDIVDVPGNQLLTRYGDGTSDASLLVMVYTPVQHHNLMADPLSGKIANAAEWGMNNPAFLGRESARSKLTMPWYWRC